MKIKIIFGLLLVLLIGIGYLSMKKDDYRKKEVIYIKEKFQFFKLEKCLKKQQISIENATAEEKEKCKLGVESQWEEAKVLNSEY